MSRQSKNQSKAVAGKKPEEPVAKKEQIGERYEEESG